MKKAILLGIVLCLTNACGKKDKVDATENQVNAMENQVNAMENQVNAMKEEVKKACPLVTVSQDLTDEEMTHLNAAVSANNAFALELFAKMTEDNASISPYSVQRALSVAYLGAANRTAEEFKKVLHVSGDPCIRHAYGKYIEDTLNASSSMKAANRLWAEASETFDDIFVKNATTLYNSAFESVDFAGNAEEVRETINAWVAERTNQRILDLLPTGSLNALTRLVITNAVYFKSDWFKPFDKSKSVEGEFTTSDGKIIKRTMMKQRDKFGYVEDDRHQVLRMGYEDGEFALYVFLPKDPSAKPLAGIDENELRNYLNTSIYRVNITMPKFKVEYSTSMVPALKALGLASAFDVADFSGMNGKKNLFISDVLHKVFVEVDEAGTEAAAATGAVVAMRMALKEPPKVDFVANRPFAYAIVHEFSKAVIFLGRVDR